MPKKGEKKGKDGRFYMPEVQEKPVEQKKFEAPSIHCGKTPEPLRKYYFENRNQPGLDARFFTDDENNMKAAKLYEFKHGSEVEMTETMYNHIRSKGKSVPIFEEGHRGELTPTGRYRKKYDYDLHEV